MNLFLKAKHWQLFIFIFALPVVVYLVTMVLFLSSINTLDDLESFAPIFSIFMPMIIVAVISSVILYCWEWSVAMGLQKYIPQETRMNKWKFQVTFILPIVYAAFILLWVFIYVIPNPEEVKHFIPWFFLILLPVHLFIMFCSFYMMFFMAKTIKLAERSPFQSSGDWGLYFVLFWFYFVGVWILQPKINKIVEEAVKEEEDVNTFLNEK